MQLVKDQLKFKTLQVQLPTRLYLAGGEYTSVFFLFESSFSLKIYWSKNSTGPREKKVEKIFSNGKKWNSYSAIQFECEYFLKNSENFKIGHELNFQNIEFNSQI